MRAVIRVAPVRFGFSVLVFLLVAMASLVPGATATDRYFSSSASCPGSGTLAAPYCALTSANTIDFAPGDKILLNRGSLWSGQQLQFQDSDDGSAVSWITVDAYGSGARPILDWTKLAGQILIRATDVDYMVVQNLEVREAHVGVAFDYTTLGHNGLKFDNLYIHDMFIDNPVYNGGALYVTSTGAAPTGTNYYLNNLTITGVEAKNTATAPSLALSDPACPSDECDTGDPFQNVYFTNNYFHDIEGATSIQDIKTLTMTGNWFVNMATVTQSQGTTNLFFWHTSDATVFSNVFDRIPDTNETDQSHIDFEGFVNDVRIRHNYFTDAAGNAIELMAWRGAGSYLTNITVDGNVFNRNAWDSAPGQFTGAIAIIKSCVFAPGPGTISNSLYYEPTGLFNTNGCSHSFTLSANTDVGSSALFAVGAKDFSSTQGTNNWRYRYSTDTGSTWTDMGYYWTAPNYTPLAQRWQINSSTADPHVARFWQTPGSSTSSVVARQWAAPSAGTVNIRSRIAKMPGQTGGDGVHVRITKNGTQIWPASGWQLVGAADLVGVVANWSGTVAVNDLIRFELKNNANNTNDYTYWMPMITYPPVGGGCGGVCWEFATAGNLEGWSPDYQSTATVSSGSLHVTATGTDAQIYNTCFSCGTGLGMSPSNRYIHLRLQNDTTSTSSTIYFITDADQTWNGAKSKAFTITANSAYTLYVVDMNAVPGWTGTIRKLRVDVGDPSVTNGLYHYDYIKALPTP